MLMTKTTHFDVTKVMTETARKEVNLDDSHAVLLISRICKMQCLIGIKLLLQKGLQER